MFGDVQENEAPLFLPFPDEDMEAGPSGNNIVGFSIGG